MVCITESQQTPVVGLDNLPRELFDHIVSYLDTKLPRWDRLHQQPTWDIFNEDECTKNLKALSLTSRKLRQLVNSALFQHLRILIDAEAAEGDSTVFSVQEQTFLTKIHSCIRFLDDQVLGDSVRSVTIGIRNAYCRNQESLHLRKSINQGSTTWALWVQSLKSTCPYLEKFLIVAPPHWVGAMVGCEISARIGEDLCMPYHILALGRQRLKSKDLQELDNNDQSQDCKTLLLSWPWTTFLLNEGSFIRLYADGTGELPQFLSGCDSSLRPFLSETFYERLTHMTYVAICPPSVPIIQNWIATLMHCRNLQNLVFQTQPIGTLKADALQRGIADYGFMAATRYTVYSYIIRHLNVYILNGFCPKLCKIQCPDPEVERLQEVWNQAPLELKEVLSTWQLSTTAAFTLEREASTIARNSLDDRNGVQ